MAANNRDHDHDEPHEVVKVTRGKATVRTADGDTQTLAVEDLVVVADFGEPIYPGLRRLGSLRAGGDKPAHVVIKGENYHVLEGLQFTHSGKVDCVYIDPPYNTGARDWKYGNDYVDKDDAYRHSKWLAFMERRLRLAKQLLNPDDSALIVTVDEKEYLRLGLLLEQVFPGVRAQMVSSVINPAGTGRQNEFSRTNEYIFFLQIGAVVIQPMLPTTTSAVPVEWEPFRRRDLSSVRPTRPRQFYPIYVDRQSNRIVGTGDPLPHETDRHRVPQRLGCAAVFPVREDGTEMNWALTRQEFERRLTTGFVRVGRHQPNGPQEYVISYLRTGPIADIESGRAIVVGHNPDGSVIAQYPAGKRRMPLTQWDFPSHDAQRYGTTLLQSFIPGRRFPFIADPAEPTAGRPAGRTNGLPRRIQCIPSLVPAHCAALGPEPERPAAAKECRQASSAPNALRMKNTNLSSTEHHSLLPSPPIVHPAPQGDDPRNGYATPAYPFQVRSRYTAPVP